MSLHRRDFLRTAAAFFGAGFPGAGVLFSSVAEADEVKTIGAEQEFSYAWLKGHARSMAEQPYGVQANALPEQIAHLDWDQYQALQFKKDHALWADDELRFRAQFFHLGLYFKRPVHLFELRDGKASEIAYDPAMFNYGKSGVDGKSLPKDLGFAGFRLNYFTDLTRDVAAFLGASYFRAVGGDWQYGLSARGLAIDTALQEEFPDFTAFWLEQPGPDSDTVTVYALLDSPSIAGAYRFLITPGQTLTMEIDAALYPRKAIERLGIAPLTSMFQYGENDRRMAWDWRPEIHDSDGLQMWSGNGEWIWRPLVNPATLRFNAFSDDNPRGFGLMQRDRNFDHYQDDGVFYEKRPSLWVEPRAGWGKGSIQLVEIPTVDETFDNIVAFWNPEQKPQPGDELLFAYKLYWGRSGPATPPLATTVATRTGLGGVVGQKRQYFSWRFAVDFVGGNLALLGPDAKVEPVIEVSRGRVEITSARPQHEISGWRAMFDLVPGDDSTDPINIRLYLKVGSEPLTETWIYQYSPPPADQRALY